MKFHEAMKALEEGKKVRGPSWPKGEYIMSPSKPEGLIMDNFGNPANANCFHVSPLWEIYEEPELYWQWASMDNCQISAFLETEEKFSGRNNQETTYYKFAGPWIKTEDGFRKHETWEQF